VFPKLKTYVKVVLF